MFACKSATLYNVVKYMSSNTVGHVHIEVVINQRYKISLWIRVLIQLSLCLPHYKPSNNCLCPQSTNNAPSSIMALSIGPIATPIPLFIRFYYSTLAMEFLWIYWENYFLFHSHGIGNNVSTDYNTTTTRFVKWGYWINTIYDTNTR